MKNHVKTRTRITGFFSLLIILSDSENSGVRDKQLSSCNPEPAEHQKHRRSD
jgi:hypothetical protein